MRRFYRRLNIPVGPGQEWKLVLPWITVAGTALVVVYVGLATGVSASVYAPMAVVIAIAFAGIPLSYLSHSPDDDRDDET
jgi:hypothetical protein